MSSIYKKGRDGYYYYQTYIFNQESQKKDRRIFHALGTKDLEDAKKKQKEYDLQYENQNNIDLQPPTLSSKLKLRSTLFIIIATIIFTIAIINSLDKTPVNTNIRKPLNFKDVSLNENNKEIKLLVSSKPNMNDNANAEIEENINIIEPKKDSIKILPVPILPEYNLERVIELPEVFNQVKIYVTLDENSNNDSQRLLCKKITKQFSEFSNIVICLYANNQAGVSLANGNDELVSIEDKKQLWLAMYSNNIVEGEYFDDNPSSYLSTF